MQDLFTGKPTCIRGRVLPSVDEQAALQDGIRRRLAALDRLRAAAARVGIGTDPDDDLVLWPEDDLILLRSADELWSELASAAQEFRQLTPIVPLETFGFPAEAEDLLNDANPALTYLGSGVEASAFVAEDGSVYKFYMPREGGTIAGSFTFARSEDVVFTADACLGSYQNLLQRMLVLHALGGMPSELVGITPEGIIVVKQTLGEKMDPGVDIQRFFPPGLIPIPGRLLRAFRDHPRLVFLQDRHWFIADLHEKNFVMDSCGAARLVDAIVAVFPVEQLRSEPLFLDWLERTKSDPEAPLLKAVSDDEL